MLFPPELFSAQYGACPACGDRDHTFLGKLGRLLWFRCRACGTDYYEKEES